MPLLIIAGLVASLTLIATPEANARPSLDASSHSGRALSAPSLARQLSNALIRVEFDDRGLTRIADLRNRRVYRLTRDEFSVVIGGEHIDSRTLAAPRATVTKDSLTFSWRAGTRVIDVVYELRPQWEFVSKQILVRLPAGATARVGELSPFRASLGEAPSSHFNPGHPRADLQTRDYGTALRFKDGHGLLVVAQNPFLQVEQRAADVSLRYSADMEWRAEYGAFPVDRMLLAPYLLSGRVLPAAMRAEWKMRDSVVAPGLDQREVEVFTEMVRAFLLYRPEQPSNVFVGWTANDYQIDVGTEAGRDEYKRIIDRAAALGAKQVLYAPANSELSRRRESTDDWWWEYVLWLGLGEKIRRNEWSIDNDAVPLTINEMVDYGRTKGVGLLAYVYPVLGFTQDTSWFVAARPGDTNRRSDLGVRALQDWLIHSLVTFRRRTGIDGYSFDHTFLTFSKTGRYAQWFGWRRVMEELRRQSPDIVIDGRQAYHQYGPWSWLAGSYPHPTANDEQPESFIPFPGLHFSRVSADRERYTAYRYRNYDFAPSEVVPGYMTHQTSRGDDTGEMPEAAVGRDTLPIRFRARDWDYLGWRYSVLSSIAIAGWNNVIDMIPARDTAEFTHFAAEDIGWWRGWIDWTASHKELLRRTRTILGQPRMGGIDGTAAAMGDSGFVFLFNPNGRSLSARIAIDASLGLTSGDRFQVREVYPRAGRLIGKPGVGFWMRGDSIEIAMDGQSASVLEIRAATPVSAPVLFGSSGGARIEGGELQLTDVRGEPGTQDRIDVVLPPRTAVQKLRVNGVQIALDPPVGDVVTTHARFPGERMPHFHPVIAYDSTNIGGKVTAALRIPRRIHDQLAARRQAWPIPWTTEDYRATWLVPDRLLLYVQIAEPDDRWEARLTIDGKPIELKKAYTAIRAARRTFVGFYADLSLLDSDRLYQLSLELPRLKPGQLQGVYLENIEPEYVRFMGR